MFLQKMKYQSIFFIWNLDFFIACEIVKTGLLASAILWNPFFTPTKEYILNRETESEIQGWTAKYSVVQTLVDAAASTRQIFGDPYFMKLRAYVLEGVFFTPAETEVATMELWGELIWAELRRWFDLTPSMKTLIHPPIWHVIYCDKIVIWPYAPPPFLHLFS